MPWHFLAEDGHDASHVPESRRAGFTDDEVMALALAEDRVLVTTDTDFGTILALTEPPARASFSCGASATPLRNVSLPLSLPRVSDELSQGAVVVIEDDRYRIRHLPIDDP